MAIGAYRVDEVLTMHLVKMDYSTLTRVYYKGKRTPNKNLIAGSQQAILSLQDFAIDLACLGSQSQCRVDSSKQHMYYIICCDLNASVACFFFKKVVCPE